MAFSISAVQTVKSSAAVTANVSALKRALLSATTRAEVEKIHPNVMASLTAGQVAEAALKTLKACEPSLLARGDSVDLALLGRQHAYLWTATKEAHHKDSALRYISRSAAASPRRADAAALNAQSLGLLSP